MASGKSSIIVNHQQTAFNVNHHRGSLNSAGSQGVQPFGLSTNAV